MDRGARLTDSGAPPRGLGRIPPPLWFFAFLLAGWALDRLLPLPIPLPGMAWRLWPAFALVGVSALVGVWAIRQFTAKATPVAPFAVPSALLTTGPFRFSRNPLYAGLVAVLAAFGLLLASFWVVLGAALLAFALDRFVVPAEEAVLARQFGEAYVDYARRVRRWLGRRRRVAGIDGLGRAG